MVTKGPPHSRRERRPPRPLDPQRLNDLALHYVARFATSAARLHDYLRRKLRERGWEGDGDPGVDALVARFVAAGYIDDQAYARAKSGSLLRRGYGERRIGQALGAAGIAEQVREEVRASAAEQRRAALTFAKKKRLGPFGPPPADRAARDKQVAAMLRAGHGMKSVRALLGAADADEAQGWADRGDED